MVTALEIWKGLSGRDTAPARFSDIPLREVIVDPQECRANCLFVALSDSPVPQELADKVLSLGAVSIVAESRLPGTKPIVWLDTAHPGEDQAQPAVQVPVGFIVPDARAALLRIAALWRSSASAQVICIVGSEGLRTAQRMMQSVLNRRFQTGAPDRLCCEAYSTALALLTLRPYSEHLLLRVQLKDEEGLRFVGETVRPDIVVVTNMSSRQDNGLRAVSQAEQHLVQALSPEELLIVNADDPAVRTMAEASAAPCFWYGLQPICDLWASHIESHGREGLRLRLHYQGDTVHVRIPLLGRYSVHTALAAAAVGLVCGESWEEIVAGLWAMSAQLHLIMTPGVNGSTFLEDSYGATPTSALSILNLLEGFPGRKVAVLGDMAELASLEVEGHRKVGRRVVDVVSYLISLGPLGHIIGREALACGLQKNHVYLADDRQQAIDRLKEILEPNDIVLVTGAGQLNMKEIVDAVVAAQAGMCEV